MRRRRRKGKASREDLWIEWISKREPASSSSRLRVGIGDDAAVWRPRPSHEIVLSVDTQVESTHFRSDWLEPRDLGFRAVAAGVSDLAAMGARPVLLLVSLHAPASYSQREFRQLHRGVQEAAQRYSMQVAGGNISRGPLAVSITAVGEAPRARALLRSGARRGDEIWVTGTPGLARLGLLALQGELALPGATPLLRPALRAFRRPVARVAEGKYLASRWPVSAMIDLSDGLARDLQHILNSSAETTKEPLGVEIDADAIRDLPRLSRICDSCQLDPFTIALSGGDDYELCFTARARLRSGASARAFRRRFSLPLSRIGRVIERPGLWRREGECLLPLEGIEPFEH